MDALIPLFLILGGIIAITIYILGMALSNAVNKLTKISEQLMIMATAKSGNMEAAKALLASASLPKREIPGVAQKKEDKKEEKPVHRVTVGLG